jgi:NADPH2:quinone reductase
MTPKILKQVIPPSRQTGRPTLDNFRLEATAMPTMPTGRLLMRVLYLSLDPYVRGRMDARKSYAGPVEIDEVMPGETVAEVIASDHADYAAGDVFLAPTSWRTHAATDGTGLLKLDSSPVTTVLGVLGMPGFTACSGLHLTGKPKAGGTVVVAAASGPVGSLVGQLARMTGPTSGRNRRQP